MPNTKLPKLPQTSTHTSATNGNNCLIHIYINIYMCVCVGICIFMTRICAISWALFAGRKRIMAPTNCTELKRKMCSRPAGRLQAVNVIHTHTQHTHTRTHIPNSHLIICAFVWECVSTTCVNNLRRLCRPSYLCLWLRCGWQHSLFHFPFPLSP